MPWSRAHWAKLRPQARARCSKPPVGLAAGLIVAGAGAAPGVVLPAVGLSARLLQPAAARRNAPRIRRTRVMPLPCRRTTRPVVHRCAPVEYAAARTRGTRRRRWPAVTTARTLRSYEPAPADRGRRHRPGP